MPDWSGTLSGCLYSVPVVLCVVVVDTTRPYEYVYVELAAHFLSKKQRERERERLLVHVADARRQGSKQCLK